MDVPDQLKRYEKIIASMIGDRTANFDLIDDEGHTRAVYHPLVIYSRLLSMEASGRHDGAICESIQTLDQAPWSALVFQVAGELFNRQCWIETARGAFANLAANQQPGGEFLKPDNSANPETRWYEELTILHAAASYAVRVPGNAIDAAVARSAEFHLNETQPDHATAQPWGLLAFVRYATPLADQVLHAMSMQYPQGIKGVPLLLLADVLYGLRRLTIGTTET